MLTLMEAKKLVESKLPKGSQVKSAIDYQDKYLFIAYTPDPLEGRLDPFYSVDKKTKEFRDFDPQSYSNPLEVFKKLDEAFVE